MIGFKTDVAGELSLRPLDAGTIEIVRAWRHEVPETLRTPMMLTYEMQQDYYENIICNRTGTTRYWGLWQYDTFVGYGGIENIQWENSTGEISILIGKKYQGRGYGAAGVRLFLEQAFYFMGLRSVWGEVYKCGNVGFWEKLCQKYNAYTTDIKYRKYFNGIYYDSMYFCFAKEDFI